MIRKIACGGILLLGLPSSIALSAPIMPDTLSGLTYWVKADAGVVHTGGMVSQWNDQSTSGINVANAIENRQPKLITGVTHGTATFNVIRFDDTPNETDFLSASVSSLPATNATGGTVFVAQMFISGGPKDNYTFSFGTNADNRFLAGGGVGEKIFAGARVNKNLADTFLTSSSLAPTSTNMYVSAASWNAAASPMTLSVLLPDNTFSTTSNGTVDTGGTYTNGVVQFGVLAFGSTSPSRVDVGEVIVFNRALSQSEIEGVSEYLGMKYGVLPIPEPSCIVTMIIGLSVGVPCLIRSRNKERIS